MLSKKLFATLAVLTATALVPATAAHATPSHSHGCPACPHPAVSVRPEPASAASQIEPTSIEFPNIV